jgi:hypothetical protein
MVDLGGYASIGRYDEVGFTARSLFWRMHR